MHMHQYADFSFNFTNINRMASRRNIRPETASGACARPACNGAQSLTDRKRQVALARLAEMKSQFLYLSFISLTEATTTTTTVS